MTDDRERILARIDEALVTPGHHPPAAPPPGGAVTARFREWLPRVGDSLEDRRSVFAAQCAALKAELCECRDFAVAAARIAEVAAEKHWQRLALHRGKLADAVAAQLPSSLELLYTNQGYDKNALESCDAGLTECECLVAQTGSICLTSRSSGGRAASVLPPHHFVVAQVEQLEPDLTAAYERLAQKYAGDYPSFINFTSGPSRTGDIERILVLGAHGPKWLTILLVE